ncbi:unnamed protein product [Boreogadus saida]
MSSRLSVSVETAQQHLYPELGFNCLSVGGCTAFPVCRGLPVATEPEQTAGLISLSFSSSEYADMLQLLHLHQTGSDQNKTQDVVSLGCIYRCTTCSTKVVCPLKEVEL